MKRASRAAGIGLLEGQIFGDSLLDFLRHSQGRRIRQQPAFCLMLSPGSDFKEKWDVQGGENQMHWGLGVYR